MNFELDLVLHKNHNTWKSLGLLLQTTHIYIYIAVFS